MQRAVWKNPSVPEEVWREAVLRGWPEAWDNPMAPFYVLTWIPREDDLCPLDEAARYATRSLWETPERCSSEGKVLIAATVREWWSASDKANRMMRFLGWWAKANGNGSAEHLEVVRILVLCARTTPDLTTYDLSALDILDAWAAGGNDCRRKAEELTSSQVVKEGCWFAQDPTTNYPWDVIREVLEAVQRSAGIQARGKHSRLLADLIRREMPSPPVVA